MSKNHEEPFDNAPRENISHYQEAITAFNQQSKKNNIGMAIGIIVGVIIGFLLGILADLMMGIMVGIVLIVISFSVALGRKNMVFKTSIAGMIVKEALGEETTYSRQGHITAKELKNINLFRVATLRTEDRIEGIYKGVKFLSVDVKSYQQSNSKNSSNVTVFFDGVLLTYDFNKPFDGELRIVEKEAGASGIVPRGLKKIEVESIDFNDNFKLYAADDLVAFYILTPPMIMALVDLRKTIKGAFNIKITGNTIYLAINGTKNHLECPTFRRFQEQDYQKMIAGLTPIKMIVDSLNLDNKHFEDVHQIKQNYIAQNN